MKYDLGTVGKGPSGSRLLCWFWFVTALRLVPFPIHLLALLAAIPDHFASATLVFGRVAAMSAKVVMFIAIFGHFAERGVLYEQGIALRR